MAQLNQVIGSILRDVAQARVMSDIYSRHISLSYEQDSLLRHFPVPRAEISEVEVDLKFGIINVGIDDARASHRQMVVQSTAELYSDLIGRSFINRLLTALEETLTDTDDSEAWQALKETYQTNGYFNKLQRILADAFLRSFGKWQPQIAEATDPHTTTADFTKAIEQKLYRRLYTSSFYKAVREFWRTRPQDEATDHDDQLNEKRQAVLTNHVAIHLNTLLDSVEAFVTDIPEYKIDVAVDVGDLLNLPASLTSSVKLKATMSNHTWTTVQGDLNSSEKVIRRLTPQ